MLPSMLNSLFDVAPLTADLIWTLSASGLVLLGAGVTLALLPWSDQDIAEVNTAFRRLVTLPEAGADVSAGRS